VGDALEKGETFGSIESVKAVEDMYAPVSGTVIERNEAMVNSPELISEDPYGEGWFLKVRINDADDLNDALSATEYRAQVEGE
jgi:glycine cleavage system H protein